MSSRKTTDTLAGIAASHMAGVSILPVLLGTLRAKGVLSAKEMTKIHQQAQRLIALEGRDPGSPEFAKTCGAAIGLIEEHLRPTATSAVQAPRC